MHMFPGPFPWFKDAAKQAAGDDFDVRRTRSHRTPECRSGPLQWPKKRGEPRLQFWGSTELAVANCQLQEIGWTIREDSSARMFAAAPPHSGAFWFEQRYQLSNAINSYNSQNDACARVSSVCLLSDNGTSWNSRLTQAATV